MGLGDFLRRLRGDRAAMPDPGSPEFQRVVEGSAIPGSTEMGQAGWASADPSPTPGEPTHNPGMPAAAAGVGAQVTGMTPEALIAAGVPPESAQATAAALAQLQEAFGGGTHTLDVEGMAGLKEQMEATLREHGVHPHSGETLDAASVPGLQEALLRVLAENGVDVSGY